MAENDNQTEMELFGSIKGVKEVSAEKLKAPFVLEKSVIRAYCTGCGYYLELNGERAKMYAEMASQAASPDKPADYFFQSSSCLNCSKEISGVKLLSVSEIK